MLSVLVFTIFAISYICEAGNGVEGCPDYPPIVPLDQSSFESILEQIDEYLNEVTTTENVPGFISTIVYDQNQIFTKGYGSRDIFNSSAPPPSGDDLVEVASITKTFTDLLLYYIRDNLPEKNLNLNDPVTKYIPSFSVKDPYNSGPTRLISLATQTSGLQRNEPCYNCNESEVMNLLSQSYLTLRPYSRFHYSNLGM